MTASHDTLHRAAHKYGTKILSDGLGREAVMSLTGLSTNAARRLINLLKRAGVPEGAPTQEETTAAPQAAVSEVVTTDEHNDSLTVECPKTRISSPEELLARAKIDLQVWEIERVTVRAWEMGSVPRVTGSDKEGWNRPDATPIITPLFAMKISLKRRTQAMALRQVQDDVLSEIRSASPSVPLILRPARRAAHGQLLYIGAHDVHIGKFADPRETTQAYTCEIAGALAEASLERLLSEAAPHGIDRILFPVGHDLVHVDGNGNMTTGGTPQDTDGRYRPMRRFAYELMVRMIRRCAEIAPVDVEGVPGNHGRETDLGIAELLEARFHNDANISVRASLTPRPYYVYGTTLLGLTHGDRIKAASLPLIMAEEMPLAWAATTHREWLLGHYHKKMTLQMMTSEDEYRGVRVRHLPSISALDYYHAAAGYSNVRAMEAYRYDVHEGYAGHHSVPVRALGVQ